MDYLWLLWLVVIISLLAPAVKQQRVNLSRLKILRRFQKKRGSRLITLIHRQEFLSFLGIPLSRFINIEDAELILRAIRLTPDDLPIDLILHTPGGLVLATEQIAAALQKHRSRVTVFVPHYAMSGGTMIALAADEIVMDENAVLGPVDPQIGSYPAASILKVLAEKKINRIDDQTLILADIAAKAQRQIEDTVYRLLGKHLPEEEARKHARLLSGGHWTHDFPLTTQTLQEFGLPVSTEMPLEIYNLMALYPQPGQRRPSVQYTPLPTGNEEGRGKPGE
ncbi:MAG: ATP-dependent Clp protease proteolytic subunit [Dethiobacteria bacterium]|jgi:ClpP class serine protease|nr:ATP-dependent Clp protease proteolytic subunit [Bacillota bacterium]NMD33688.1 hypothetical protein [Bacillota bacterium]HOB29562.1 ATP-dependent Clp protease proteolytic subunit [Bacillota bacterium]HPZ42184.1 ATP-dependent Clp protease proteolytic subunit [Bacillota bacterium]HQD52994.1 ATP-dependent Clp protease proteolytic subunit [Bacillota bacterium]